MALTKTTDSIINGAGTTEAIAVASDGTNKLACVGILGGDGTNFMPSGDAAARGVFTNVGLGGVALDGNSGNKSAQTLRVVLATDQPTMTNPQPVTPAAGELHLGEVGGNSAIISPTVTVSTSPAYTAGDTVGGKLTLTNALRAAGHNVVLQSIDMLDAANQKPTGSILIFNADPAAATTTDNGAFVYSTDFGKQIARIPVASTDWVTVNSKASCVLPNLGRVLAPASGTTLYAVFVTDTTPTFVATTDLTINFGLLRD